MKIFLISMLLLLTPNSQGCLKMDIMLLGDLSGSIAGSERFVADALEAFIERFELGENSIRIGAAVFDDNVLMLSNITHEKEKLLSGINYIRIRRLGGTTAMSKAIEYMEYQFSDHGRPGVKKMLIIISDGVANKPVATLMAINNLKARHEVKVCGIYVHTLSGGNEDFMISISNSACYSSSNYYLLADELERLNICL